MLIVATWGGLMISDHARIRMQQRGIPPLILEWLNEYGHPVFDHHGGKILYFDKVARKRLSHDKGRTAIRRLHEYLDRLAFQVPALDRYVERRFTAASENGASR